MHLLLFEHPCRWKQRGEDRVGGEFVLLIRGAARPTIYPLALTEVGVNGKAGASKNSQFSSESNVDVVVERYNLKLCTRV